LAESDLSAPAVYVAPRTSVEAQLAGIWSEVLGVKRIGVQDSFFELGGHSLLATQVLSRIRRTLGVSLPLQGLFEAPTLAALAERIEALGLAQPGGLTPAAGFAGPREVGEI
jgi:acyl carrier protein